MKEWDQEHEESSIALTVEAIVLAIMWVFALVAFVTALAESA